MAAQPTINGNPSPQQVPLTWPVPTPVQLDNVVGAATYLWQIVDQPEGAADLLSNPAIKNPTIAPRKEGTYLLRLIVDQGQATESVATALFWIKDLKTGLRPPAAGEKLEQDLVRGWATDANRLLLAGVHQDPGVVIGEAGVGGLQARQTIMRVGGVVTIKAGFPGEERLPSFRVALADTARHMRGPLFFLDRGVDGSFAPALGDLIRARISGLVTNLAAGGQANNMVIGDRVWATDAGGFRWGSPATRYPRHVGTVVWADALADSYDMFFDGHAQMGAVGGAPLCFGNSTLSAVAGTKLYLDVGYVAAAAPVLAARAGVVRPTRAGRYSRLRVYAEDAPVCSHKITVRKNGVLTLLTATITPLITSVLVEDDSLGFDYLPTDVIDVEAETIGNGNSAGRVHVLLEDTRG